MNKKRVLIAGFYGARNVGDELMLKSILSNINQKKYHITILIAKNPELNAEEEYAPFNTVYCPENTEELAALASNYDAIIWGGGAMIDDEDYKTKPFLGLAYIMTELTLSILKNNGQALVLGVSTNKELKNKIFIEKIQYIIDNSSVFSLRDKNSLKTLKCSGLKTKKILLCDDLVVSNLKIQKIKKKNSFYSLGLVYIYNEKTINYLLDFSSKLIESVSDIQSKPIQIKLIPFYDYCNNDVYYCNVLKNNLLLKYPNINVTIISPVPSTMNLLYLSFAGCDLIVTMRYHALLVASLLGYKTISLDYSNMHRHYINKISDIASHYKSNFLSIEFPQKINEINTKKLNAYIKKTKRQNHISKKYLRQAKRQLKNFLKKLG